MQPGVLILNSDDLYKDIFTVISEEGDIREIFNQAVDCVTDGFYSGCINYKLDMKMLRCCNPTRNTIAMDNEIKLFLIYQKICYSLKDQLTDLKALPIIDASNMREHYPYYFHDLIRGKIILKRL